MLTFRIDARKYSPQVFINRNEHLINISGVSTLRNTSWFYSNVLKWVIAFNNDNTKPITININLKQINDSSSKWLVLIMQKLAALVRNQKITVNWYYQERNASVQLSGERLKLNSEIPINLIAA